MGDRDYKKRTPLQVAAELGMLLGLLYWLTTQEKVKGGSMATVLSTIK